MIKKIKINFKISGTRITIPFKTICSVTDKEFEGNIIVEYHPNKEVVEFVSLEDFINEITKNKLTAEELADLIYEEIGKNIDAKYLNVAVDIIKSQAHQPAYVWKESE